ncbi:MAG TPA: hypothetical protein VHT01_05440, partial [Candidatus Udaeobacter sp.]|nr:hypothetical protein [Candidatus Udaeobacter sp.]
MKNLWLAIALFVGSGSTICGNGGAWQTGIPATGNASSSKNDRHTDVTIENESLKIDLHPEYADVTVRYRMHNTGPKVQQDFFFPVERWGENPDSDNQGKSNDIDFYQINVDGKELKSTNVAGPKQKSSEAKEEITEANQQNSKANQKPTEETSKTTEDSSQAEGEEDSGAEGTSDVNEENDETTSGSFWQQDLFTIKSWKKSVIPFERNQTRDVTIHYKAGYSENDESVSDDSHISNATFAYSLSPAATWKGPIGKGRIEINILHPEPEDVSIQKPKDRFKKVSDTRYEWEFKNLKPTMEDDIRIVAHSKYDSYPTGYSEEDFQRRAEYVIRGNQYFLDNTDYDATATSTLAPQGKHHYEVQNIKGRSEEGSPWAEGVDGDGIGESITLDVKRPLPLY